MTRIDILYRLPASPERVFDHLAEHANLSRLFRPAVVTRIQADPQGGNGVGSVRRLSLPLLPAFEETVTRFERPHRIEYRISRGSPLRNHRGVMSLTQVEQGTQLHYTIEFESPVPGLAPLVGKVLERNIRKGLGTLRF